MKLRFKQIAYSCIALFLVFEHLAGARVLQILPGVSGGNNLNDNTIPTAYAQTNPNIPFGAYNDGMTGLAKGGLTGEKNYSDDFNYSTEVSTAKEGERVTYKIIFELSTTLLKGFSPSNSVYMLSDTSSTGLCNLSVLDKDFTTAQLLKNNCDEKKLAPISINENTYYISGAKVMTGKGKRGSFLQPIPLGTLSAPSNTNDKIYAKFIDDDTLKINYFLFSDKKAYSYTYDFKNGTLSNPIIKQTLYNTIYGGNHELDKYCALKFYPTNVNPNTNNLTYECNGIININNYNFNAFKFENTAALNFRDIEVANNGTVYTTFAVGGSNSYQGTYLCTDATCAIDNIGTKSLIYMENGSVIKYTSLNQYYYIGDETVSLSSSPGLITSSEYPSFNASANAVGLTPKHNGSGYIVYANGKDLYLYPGVATGTISDRAFITGNITNTDYALVGFSGSANFNGVDFTVYANTNCSGSSVSVGKSYKGTEYTGGFVITGDYCIEFSGNSDTLAKQDVSLYFARTNFYALLSGSIDANLTSCAVTNTVTNGHNETSLHTFNVKECTPLRANKSLSGTVTSGYAIGDKVTFKLTITNDGTGDAGAIDFQDILSSTGVLQWTGGITTSGGCALEKSGYNSKGSLTGTISSGSLKGNASCDIIINAAFTGYGCYTNTGGFMTYTDNGRRDISGPQGSGITVCSTGLNNLKLQKYLIKTGVSDYRTVSSSTTEPFYTNDPFIRVIQWQLLADSSLAGKDGTSNSNYTLRDVVLSDKGSDYDITASLGVLGSPINPSVAGQNGITVDNLKLGNLTGGMSGYIIITGTIISGANSKPIFSNTVSYKNGGQSATATGAFTGKTNGDLKITKKLVSPTNTGGLSIGSGVTFDITLNTSGTVNFSGSVEITDSFMGLTYSGFSTPADCPNTTLSSSTTSPIKFTTSFSGNCSLRIDFVVANTGAITNTGCITKKNGVAISPEICSAVSLTSSGTSLSGNHDCTLTASMYSGGTASSGQQAINFTCTTPIGTVMPASFKVSTLGLQVSSLGNNSGANNFAGILSGASFNSNPAGGTNTSVEVKCEYSGANRTGSCTTTVMLSGTKLDSSITPAPTEPPKDGKSNNSNPSPDGKSGGGGQCKGGQCKKKEAQGSNFAPGATVPYSAGIVNNDPEVAMEGIQFRDQLPDGMSMYEWTASIDGQVVKQGNKNGAKGRVDLTQDLIGVVIPPSKTLDINYITKIDSGYNFGSFVSPAANLYVCDDDGNAKPASGTNNNNPPTGGNSGAPSNQCGGGASNAAGGDFKPQSVSLPSVGTGSGAGQVSTGGTDLKCEPKLYDINVTKKIITEKLKVGESLKFEITIKNEGVKTVTGLVVQEQFSGMIIKPPFVVSGSGTKSNYGIVPGYYSNMASGSFNLMSGGTLSGGESVTIVVDSILSGTKFVNMIQACNYKDELDPDSDACNGFDKGEDDSAIVSGGLDTASLGDKIWFDSDGNGLQNTGEKGVGDMSVQLVTCGTDVVIASGRTNSDGIYGFSNVVPGKYAVRFDTSTLKGFALTLSNVGNDDSIDSDGDKIDGKYALTECITLSGGQSYLGHDLGISLDFKNLTGLSFLSISKTLMSTGIVPGQELIFMITVANDGIMGVSGVSIKDKFVGLSGLKVGTSINNLTPLTQAGNDITIRSGIVLGGKPGGLGNSNCTGTDCPKTYGPTGSNQLILYVSTILTGYSFSNYVQLCDYNEASEGIRPPVLPNKPCDYSTNQADDDSVSGSLSNAMLGDYIWKDSNKNGIQDAGELGLSNIDVELYACNSTTLIKKLKTSNGNYKFDNLAPGSYQIKVPLLGSNEVFAFSPGFQGSDTTKDSDAKNISGKVASSDCISVSGGSNVDTIDFGIYIPTTDIKVTKTALKQYALSGEAVSFAISISNAGNGTIKSYSFTDILTSGMTFTGINTTDVFVYKSWLNSNNTTGGEGEAASICGSPSGGFKITDTTITATMSNVNLSAGMTCNYIVNAKVTTAVTGALPTNTISIPLIDYESNSANNSASASLSIQPACNLITLSKDAGDNPFTLQYTIAGSNGTVRILDSNNNQVGSSLSALNGSVVIPNAGKYVIEYTTGSDGFKCIKPFVVKELSECVGLSVTPINDKQYNLSCSGNFATNYSLVMESFYSSTNRFMPVDGGIISGNQGIMTLPLGLNDKQYRFRCIVNSGIDYSLDKISATDNVFASQFECPYKVKSDGKMCAVDQYIAPIRNKLNFDSAMLASLPDPIEYCSPTEASNSICVNGAVSSLLVKNYANCQKTITYFAPDLLITKSADKGAFNSGELITYTINVMNIGSGASKGLMVRDKAYGMFKIESVTGLPETERFNFNDYTALYRDYSGITLNPGQSQQFKYTLRLLNASVSEIKNEASVLAFSGSSTESNYDNNRTTNIISKQGDSIIGDFVWMDANKNGTQDAGEMGIKNLQVQLLNCTSLSPLFVSFTDNNGLYKFSGIGSGSYRVLVQVPDTYRISPRNIGGMDKDSNIDPMTNMSECFTLSQGQIRTDIDAGLFIDPTLPPQNTNCGNSKIEPQYGEQCDGNAVGSDATCKNCQIIKNNISICGNAVLEQSEDCEVGNVPAGKTCYNCKLTENSTCGDGKVGGYEECDINTPAKPGFSCIGCIFVPNTLANCGNGKQELGEACDLGSANGSNSLIPAGPNAGKKCTIGCNVINTIGPIGGQVVLSYEPPSCTDIDPPAAMEGEYFPFWWDIDDSNVTTSCTRDGQILRDSMNCVFDLYAGKGGTTEAIKTFSTACYNVSNFDGTLLSIFNSKTADKYGKAQIMLDKALLNGKYGEYKLRLKKIDYKVCQGTGVNNGSIAPFNTFNDSYDETICEYNFTITRPYLMQVGGLLSSNATDSLYNFYGFSSNEGSSNILSKYGVTLQNTPLDQFAGSANLNYLVDSFANKYDKLAVANIAAGANSYKVPGKEIYVYRGTMTYDESQYDNSKPKTIIITDGDLKIIGNVKGSTLFVVPNGNIIIATNDCNTTQVLNGIFITKNSILSDRNYINNNLANTRCTKGNLEIKGLVVGKGLQDLVEKRRSVLDGRFVKNNKKDAVVYGASVLITSSDAMFNAGIPGLDEFNKELSSYKR